MTDKLADLKNLWKNTQPLEGFTSLPDGNYQFIIDDVYLAKSRKNQRYKLIWELRVVSGDHAGTVQKSYMDAENEFGIMIIKRTLDNLDVEIPDDFEELGQTVQTLKGQTVEGTVKSNDRGTNIYLNSIIDLMEEDDDLLDDIDEEDED